MGYPEQGFCYFEARQELLCLSRALPSLAIGMAWDS